MRDGSRETQIETRVGIRHAPMRLYKSSVMIVSNHFVLIRHGQGVDQGRSRTLDRAGQQDIANLLIFCSRVDVQRYRTLQATLSGGPCQRSGHRGSQATGFAQRPIISTLEGGRIQHEVVRGQLGTSCTLASNGALVPLSACALSSVPLSLRCHSSP